MNGNVGHSSVKFAGSSAVSTTRPRIYFRTERMKRMSGIPDKMGSRVIGVNFQISEQKRFAAWLVAAAIRLDSHEYGIDLREHFRIITL